MVPRCATGELDSVPPLFRCTGGLVIKEVMSQAEKPDNDCLFKSDDWMSSPYWLAGALPLATESPLLAIPCGTGWHPGGIMI